MAETIRARAELISAMEEERKKTPILSTVIVKHSRVTGVVKDDQTELMQLHSY